MDPPTNPERYQMAIRFADGRRVLIRELSAALTEARMGAVASMLTEVAGVIELPDLDVKDSRPFVEFLESGKYALANALDASALALASEAACYKALHDRIHVPGLLRDIEACIHDRVVAGIVGIDVVRETFKGYDRVDGMCDTFNKILPETQKISHQTLREALGTDGTLFAFYGDKFMWVVCDMEFMELDEDEDNNEYHTWMTRSHGATGDFVTSNPSNKRYLSYTATRHVTVVPGNRQTTFDDGEGLVEHFARTRWTQVGLDGTDAPVFPPLHSIDAVVGLCPGSSKKRFVFTRNDVWQFAYNGKKRGEHDVNGWLGRFDY